MSDGEKLESLADANARRVNEWLKKAGPSPSGISCPECGKELLDANDGTVLLTVPPQVRVHCPCCNWKGTRVQ